MTEGAVYSEPTQKELQDLVDRLQLRLGTRVRTGTLSLNFNGGQFQSWKCEMHGRVPGANHSRANDQPPKQRADDRILPP
jgi:hypothetical protein